MTRRLPRTPASLCAKMPSPLARSCKRMTRAGRSIRLDCEVMEDPQQNCVVDSACAAAQRRLRDRFRLAGPKASISSFKTRNINIKAYAINSRHAEINKQASTFT